VKCNPHQLCIRFHKEALQQSRKIVLEWAERCLRDASLEETFYYRAVIEAVQDEYLCSVFLPLAMQWEFILNDFRADYSAKVTQEVKSVNGAID